MKTVGRTVILLTACVRPVGISQLKVTDHDVRLSQYQTAVEFYLSRTQYQIVLVDSSDYDFSDLYHKSPFSERIECLSFSGDIFDGARGKGYGEGLIIKFAFLNSVFVKNAKYVIKVTGRLIVENINLLCKQWRTFNLDAVCADSDLKLKYTQSQFFVAPKLFLSNYLIPLLGEVDDSKDVHFEHVLSAAIKSWKGAGGKHMMFITPILLKGVSGSTGREYRNCSLKRYAFVAIKTLIYKLKRELS